MTKRKNTEDSEAPPEVQEAPPEDQHPLQRLDFLAARVEELEQSNEAFRVKAQNTELRLNQLITRVLTPQEQQNARKKVAQRISTRKLAAALHRSGDRPKGKMHLWLIKDRDMQRPFKFLSAEGNDPSVVKAEYEKASGRSWTGADDDPLEVTLSSEAV